MGRRTALLLLAALGWVAPAEARSLRPAVPVVEGTRYSCPGLADEAPSTTFFDNEVYQGDDGWFFRVGNDANDFMLQAPQVTRMVARLAEALARRGVRLVYLPIPTRAMTDADRLPEGMDDGVVYDADLAAAEYHALVESLSAAGVPTVDLLAAREAGGTGGPFHFARDTHWRPEGARAAAAAVADFLDREGWLDDLPRRPFASAVTVEAALVSPMRRALQDLCVDPLDPETLAVFETSLAEVTADDLLGGGEGEDEAAPLALAGTSYSDIAQFNFAGFLSEATGLDVANHAISGGGTWTSLLDWTHAAAMDGPLPRVLVWENPVAYRLDAGGVAALRQIIPAVAGGCSAAEWVHRAVVTVEPGRPGVAEIPPAVAVSGHGARLALTLSDARLRAFTLTLETRAGDVEDVAVSRPPRMGDTDRAFLELSDDFDAPLARITVAAAVEAPTAFTIDVCQTGGS